MSNPNAPFGFRHIGAHDSPAAPNFASRTVKIEYNYGVALYKGDVLVYVTASDYCARYSTGVTGSNVAGVVEGFEYYSASQGKKVMSTYLPVGDTPYDVECTVVPIAGVPPQEFLVQGGATPFSTSDIGKTIEPAVGGTGTIIGGYGKSAMTLAEGTNVGTDNTKPFRIVGLYSKLVPTGTPGTDDTSGYNIVIVASNPYEATGI